MQDAAYRKRLAADLPKWLDAGWVNADGAAAILGAVDATPRRAAFSLSAILGTLGALLIGLAVLAWVGAQWEAVPRVARLALIVVAMLVAYGVAFQFDRRQLRIFAEAGVLAGGLVYAGGIALIGQTYHLAGDFAGAVMLFEAGILGAALFTGSPTMNVLGLIGAGYWTWLAVVDDHVLLHWPSLGAILIGVVVATVQNSHYGRIVAVIAAMYWVALTIFGFGDANHWSLAGGMALYAAVSFAIWSLGAALASIGGNTRVGALGDAILWPGLFAILVTVGVLQIADHPLHAGEQAIVPALVAAALAILLTGFAFTRRAVTVIDVVAVAGLSLASVAFAYFLPPDDLVRNVLGGVIVVLASLWAVTLGQSGRHPIGKSIGLVAFGLEVIYVYVFTIGTRLDTALAFLIGGVLFIVLAYVLFRIDRLLARRAAAAEIVADLKRQPVPVPDLPESLRSVELPTPPPPEGEAEAKP
ncbi:MAG TPA: DUF2157 domain-containing protein [Bauldia sp.]|nr:DUF2157 domain-containing protein [Bauldia sp.]